MGRCHIISIATWMCVLLLSELSTLCKAEKQKLPLLLQRRSGFVGFVHRPILSGSSIVLLGPEGNNLAKIRNRHLLANPLRHKQSPTRLSLLSSLWSKKAKKARFPTELSMGFFVSPPGGGGGGGPQNNNNNDNALINGLSTVLFFSVLFFTPLGNVVFAITNSLFLISVFAPLLIFAGFQIWKGLNTIEGACPSCQAPVVVLKSKGGDPSFCLNCGATVRASTDLKSVELCNAVNDEFLESGNAGNDGFFGGVSGGTSSSSPSLSDLFSGVADGGRATGKGGVGGGSAADRSRKERTIIDVEIVDD